MAKKFASRQLWNNGRAIEHYKIILIGTTIQGVNQPSYQFLTRSALAGNQDCCVRKLCHFNALA